MEERFGSLGRQNMLICGNELGKQLTLSSFIYWAMRRVICTFGHV